VLMEIIHRNGSLARVNIRPNLSFLLISRYVGNENVEEM
jgi:hypothetical protein